MWSLGIILLIVVLGLSAAAYMLYIRKKQIEAAKKIHDLNVQRDTAHIVEEFKREQIEKSWEEFDKQQWELRFGEEVK